MNPNKCPQNYRTDDLILLASGDVSPRTAARMRRHTAQCAVCMAALQEIESLWSLSQAFRSEPVSETLLQITAARIAQKPTKSSRPVFAFPKAFVRPAIAMVAVASIGLTLALVRVPSSSTPASAAFAEVEDALAGVQTVNWTEHSDHGLVLRPDGSSSMLAARRQRQMWAQLRPERFAEISWNDTRHVSTERNTYQIEQVNDFVSYAGYQWGFSGTVRLMPNGGKTAEGHLRDMMLFAPKKVETRSTSGQATDEERIDHQTDWTEKDTTLEGRRCKRLDASVFYNARSKHNAIGHWHTTENQWSVWVDQATRRIVKRELTVRHQYGPTGKMAEYRLTADHFRYNVPAPTGIFDYLPKVGQRYRYVPLPERKATPEEQQQIETLYAALIAAWNRGDADAMAALSDFGYDPENQRRSPYNRTVIEQSLRRLRNLKSERHNTARTRITGIFTQTSAQTPFPPTEGNEFACALSVNGVFPDGKPGTGFLELNVHRDEQGKYRIVRFSPHFIRPGQH